MSTERPPSPQAEAHSFVMETVEATLRRTGALLTVAAFKCWKWADRAAAASGSK